MKDKTSPGQPTPLRKSSRVNDVLDATDYYSSQIELGRGLPAHRELRNYTCVGIKNSTGAARVRGEVVQLGASQFSTLKPYNLWFDSDLPDSSPTERFAIMREALPAGSILDCGAQVSGVCFALIDVTDDTHKYATPVENDPILQSATSGPVEILHKPAGTGNAQECIVVLRPSPASGGAFSLGRVTQSGGITARSGNTVSSGDVTRYERLFSSTLLPTGDPVQAYNVTRFYAYNNAWVLLWQDGNGDWLLQDFIAPSADRAVGMETQSQLYNNVAYQDVLMSAATSPWMTDTNLRLYANPTLNRLELNNSTGELLQGFQVNVTVNLGILASALVGVQMSGTGGPSITDEKTLFHSGKMSFSGTTTEPAGHVKLQIRTGNADVTVNFGRLWAKPTGQNEGLSWE